MLGITHLLFGLFVGAAWQSYFGGDLAIIFFAALGALFPDIDHPQSILGRHVKPVGWFTKHRGYMHSLLVGVFFTVILDLVLRGAGLHSTSYPLVFLLGFLSHLLLDGSTKGGVRALWPTKIVFRGPRKIGGLSERAFQIVLVVALVLI